jgi:outer membrane receptor protein involved in Fe transport
VIAALEARGLDIIYSNDLVDSAMTVRDVPTTSDPVELLRQVLQPYGLGLRQGPRGAWLVVRESSVARPPPTIVRGRVLNADSGEPVGHAKVRVIETGASTSTTARGAFRLEVPAPGRYRVSAEAEGYDPGEPLFVEVVAGSETPPVKLELRARALPIETIVVSASYYTLGREPAPSSGYLSAAQIENLPTVGEDALRATHTLPGLASSGVTARSNVRGGNDNETLLLLDGMRIYDPFHFRDFESLFSSIDPAVIDGIEVRTGGYPAPYGDRASAVIEMQSLTPPDAREQELRVSLVNSAFLSTGRFADGRGGWVGSLRRSNIDLLVKAIDPELGEPEYFDTFGKLSYAINDHLRVTGNALALDDEISLHDEDVAAASADYSDGYYWVRFDHAPGTAFEGSYLLSQTRLRESHDGFLADPGRAFGELAESRDVTINAIAAQWQKHFSDRQLLKWGAELRDGRASYDHSAQASYPNPIEFEGMTRTGVDVGFDVHVDGQQRALYASHVSRWTKLVTSELGLRWDSQSYTGESQLSPRINLLFDVGPRTQVRAAAGRYYQAQGFEELQISDGVSTFFPAERARHLVLSVEHRFDDALHLKIEAYSKRFDRLHPRFENLYSRLDLLPELQPDRVRIDAQSAHAQGIELLLEQDVHDWHWWVNVTRSSVEDRIGTIDVPRSWDQPWSIGAGAIWTRASWTASLVATYHSGWPVTSLSLVDDRLVAGAFNAGRVARFQSIDLRLSRVIELPRSELTVFGEVINALDHSNPCCVAYDLEADPGEDVALELGLDDWLPRVPSVGVAWKF